MSYKATAWAYDLPLKGPAKPVLTALADFADEAGSCYPGQERLCDMTGLSLRTVRRALERLERLELITRERRFDQYGHRTSDRYYLSLEAKSLPVRVTGGQSDLRSESPSLPVTLSIPTGHSDRVTISRTTRENHQGAQAPTPPVDNSQTSKTEPPTKCPEHQHLDIPPRCGRCKDARKAHDAWVSQQPAPTPEPPRTRSKHWRPGLCEAHLHDATTCDACAEDRRKGRTA